MATMKNMLPDKRRITVLVGVILLLAMFLLPYFLLYIPGNEDNLKREAFMKLSRASRNLINKTSDQQSFYKTNPEGADTLGPAERGAAECGAMGNHEISALDSVYFSFTGAGGWNVIFTQKSLQKGNRLVHRMSLAPFVEACLSSGKDVFASFLLLHYCHTMGGDSNGKVIYQDLSQSIEQEVLADSLFPRHQGFRDPDIISINLQGTDYKLFTYPFQIGRHRLLIAGLMRGDVYSSRLHTIPVGTFYTVIICLLLFLLSLPFLKIFMMNDRDRIYAANLLQGGVYLFALASFLTIIITQLVLLWEGQRQASDRLTDLSGAIRNGLDQELGLAQKDLRYFDSTLSHFLDPSAKGLAIRPAGDSLRVLISQRLDSAEPGSGKLKEPDQRPGPQKFVASGKKHTARVKGTIMFLHAPAYPNWDHFGWINKAGQETIRMLYLRPEPGQNSRNRFRKDSVRGGSTLLDDSTRFVDVRARDYFREMSRRQKYGVPDSSNILIAPVQSWASGEFRVNLCRFSRIPGIALQLMDTRLYSLVNAVLPAGFGFCLITDSGAVMIHSDTLRSLRENFFDETGNLPSMQAALRGRQPFTSGQVDMYGSTYTLHIRPLRQHSLFLATFYNNAYLEPTNLRILSFAVLFSLLTYGFFAIVFRILYKRNEKSFLFSPTDYLKGTMPRTENMNLYFNGSLLLGVYIFCFIAIAAMSGHIGRELDYSMLVFAVLSPANLLYTLWLMHARAGTSRFLSALRFIVLPLTAAIVFYFVMRAKGWPLEPVSFWGMEGLFYCGLLLIVLRKPAIWSRFRQLLRRSARRIGRWDSKTTDRQKTIAYSFFVTGVIFTAAVLPILEFTWFAYNHELRQSVKKEQLYLADGIQKKERTIRSFLRRNQPGFTGFDANADTILFRRGVYSTYKDTVDFLSRNATAAQKAAFTRPKPRTYRVISDNFYLTIARRIGALYKDPVMLPSLPDTTDGDGLWNWSQDAEHSEFDYRRPDWTGPADSATIPRAALMKLRAQIPGGCELDTGMRIAFLLLMFALVCAVFQITRSIVVKIYLTRMVGAAGRGLHQPRAPSANKFWQTCLAVADLPAERKNEWRDANALLASLAGEYALVASGAEDIETREQDILARCRELTPVFQCLWKTIDDKEKYLLYCLANDGMVNTRNKQVLYALLDKGAIIIYDQQIRLVGYSFREFILSRNNTPEEAALLKKMESEASWGFLRTVLLVVIISLFIFLVLTQQEVSTKIVTLVTALGALVPVLLRIGVSSPPQESGK